jgi:hypothetical protein
MISLTSAPTRSPGSCPSTFFLDRYFDLRVHRADDSTVTLEYASEGKVVRTGRP